MRSLYSCWPSWCFKAWLGIVWQHILGRQSTAFVVRGDTAWGESEVTCQFLDNHISKWDLGGPTYSVNYPWSSFKPERTTRCHSKLDLDAVTVNNKLLMDPQLSATSSASHKRWESVPFFFLLLVAPPAGPVGVIVRALIVRALIVPCIGNLSNRVNLNYTLFVFHHCVICTRDFKTPTNLRRKQKAELERQR